MTHRMIVKRGLVGRNWEYKPNASVPSMRAEPTGPHAKARLRNSAVSSPRQVWSRAEAARRRPIQGRLNLAAMGPWRGHMATWGVMRMSPAVRPAMILLISVWTLSYLAVRALC